ncbi:MAG TPA: CYTH domain-containing protein [Gammaproteobacteria bacterium]|nr:CYTH domain-containing protein [Gammaproteobacteria bacterium]
MATEIERKFLVSSAEWKGDAVGHRLQQGYLSLDKARTIRVRVAEERAWINIKGLTRGITRSEFEYPVPLEDARRMLDELCIRPVIDKTRYLIPCGRHRWEVDEFHGRNAGLVIAEIELAREDEDFERPHWLGEEVSGDPRYFNASLVTRPFLDWAAPPGRQENSS